MTGGGNRHLLTGSAWLVVTFGINGLSGSMFWLVASHVATKGDVGIASALVSSVVFLGFVAGLGMPFAIARFGHDAGDATWLLRVAAVASALTGVIGSAIYVLAIRAPATAAVSSRGRLAGVTVTAVLVTGSCVAMAVDARLIVDRRWGLVVGRVAAGALLRFPLLLAVPRHGAGIWLAAANAGPPALSGYLALALLARTRPVRPDRSSLVTMLRFSAVNYLANLAAGAAIFALPVIVLVSVSPAANANFYIVWGVVSLTGLIPTTIGQVLLAEGGRPGAPAGQVRVALVAAVGVMAAVAAVAAAGRGAVVAVYGHGYRQAADLLPVLVAAGIPAAAVTILITEARLRRDSVLTVAIPAVSSVTVLGVALVTVPHGGTVAAARSWLLGNLVGFAAALVLRHRRAPAPVIAPPGRSR